MLKKWLVTTPDLPNPGNKKSDDEEIILMGKKGVIESGVSPAKADVKRKHGAYAVYDIEQRAKMAKYAVENGVMNASRKFEVS